MSDKTEAQDKAENRETAWGLLYMLITLGIGALGALAGVGLLSVWWPIGLVVLFIYLMAMSKDVKEKKVKDA